MNEIDIKTFIEVDGVEYCISTTWLSKTISLYETMVFEAMNRKYLTMMKCQSILSNTETKKQQSKDTMKHLEKCC